MAHQGDPISAYIFIPAFKYYLFWLEAIKTLKVSIFLIIFFSTVYADDTTFFLEKKESIEELVYICFRPFRV